MKMLAAMMLAMEFAAPAAQAGPLLENPLIIEIGRDLAKTSAQVVLRWRVQHGASRNSSDPDAFGAL